MWYNGTTMMPTWPTLTPLRQWPSKRYGFPILGSKIAQWIEYYSYLMNSDVHFFIYLHRYGTPSIVQGLAPLSPYIRDGLVSDALLRSQHGPSCLFLPPPHFFLFSVPFGLTFALLLELSYYQGRAFLHVVLKFQSVLTAML